MGFPIRKSAGQRLLTPHRTLIAACHVLHRLYAPRHPRIALTSRLRAHTTNINAGSNQKATRLGKSSVACGIRCVDFNLSQILSEIEPASSLGRPQPRGSARLAQSRYLHGIDFKNPFTMSKRRRLTPPVTAMLAHRGSRVFISRYSVSVVEPIGIEPMT